MAYRGNLQSSCSPFMFKQADSGGCRIWLAQAQAQATRVAGFIIALFTKQAGYHNNFGIFSLSAHFILLLSKMSLLDADSPLLPPSLPVSIGAWSWI